MKTIELLTWEYLLLEDQFDKLNRAEYDYYWNVIAYRRNWETFDFKENDRIINRQEEIKKEIKERLWNWNYFLFNFFRSHFIKKFKGK